MKIILECTSGCIIQPTLYNWEPSYPGANVQPPLRGLQKQDEGTPLTKARA